MTDNNEPDILHDGGKSARAHPALKEPTQFLLETGFGDSSGNGTKFPTLCFPAVAMNDAVLKFARYIAESDKDETMSSSYARLYRNDNDWNIAWTKE